MVLLSLLLSCALPSDEPVALDLPGQVTWQRVEVTDDGAVLTFQRRPSPIRDATMFVLMVFLFPGAGIFAGVYLRSEGRVLAVISSGAILAADLGVIWGSQFTETMIIDRSAQSVSIRGRLHIGIALAEVRLPLSAVPRIGVVVLSSDTADWVVLELLETDGTPHRMTLGALGEDGSLGFAAALRDHTADAMGIEQVEETRRRLWW